MYRIYGQPYVSKLESSYIPEDYCSYCRSIIDNDNPAVSCGLCKACDTCATKYKVSGCGSSSIICPNHSCHYCKCVPDTLYKLDCGHNNCNLCLGSSPSDIIYCLICNREHTFRQPTNCIIS